MLTFHHSTILVLLGIIKNHGRKVSSTYCFSKDCYDIFRSGASSWKALGPMDRDGLEKLPTNDPRWKDLMKDGLYIPSEALIIYVPTKRSGKKMMLKPEQNFVKWIMDLMSEFYNAGNQAFRPWAGTLVPGKAWLRVPENSHFVGCNKTSMPFHDMPLSLLKANAKQVLITKSCKAKSEEAGKAIKFCKRDNSVHLKYNGR